MNTYNVGNFHIFISEDIPFNYFI